MGQRVGDLWSDGGLSLNIPHREEHPFLYVSMDDEHILILPKRVVSPDRKFATTNKDAEPLCQKNFVLSGFDDAKTSKKGPKPDCRVGPLDAPSRLASGSNQRVLGPLATPEQHADGLGPVGLPDRRIELLEVRDLDVSNGQNHVALLETSPRSGIGRGLDFHAASQFQLLLLRVAQIADRQPE